MADGKVHTISTITTITEKGKYHVFQVQMKNPSSQTDFIFSAFDQNTS